MHRLRYQKPDSSFRSHYGSPAGGVSSSVNDLAKWMRMQLANGQYEGKQLVDAKASFGGAFPGNADGFSPLPIDTGAFNISACEHSVCEPSAGHETAVDDQRGARAGRCNAHGTLARGARLTQ